MKYVLIAALGLGTLIACAPKTTEVVTETAEMEEVVETTTNETMETFDDATVAAGKEVFENNCISCHYGRRVNEIPQLVDSYTRERWDEILADMTVRAELGSEDKGKLRSYIYWELSN